MSSFIFSRLIKTKFSNFVQNTLNTLLESVFWGIILSCPLWLNILILQSRNNQGNALSLNNELREDSAWMYLTPNTILVSKEGFKLKKFLKKHKIYNKLTVIENVFKGFIYLGILATTLILVLKCFKGLIF